MPNNIIATVDLVSEIAVAAFTKARKVPIMSNIM